MLRQWKRERPRVRVGLVEARRCACAIQKRKEPLKVYLKGLKVGDDLLSRSAVSSAALA